MYGVRKVRRVNGHDESDHKGVVRASLLCTSVLRLACSGGQLGVLCRAGCLRFVVARDVRDAAHLHKAVAGGVEVFRLGQVLSYLLRLSGRAVLCEALEEGFAGGREGCRGVGHGQLGAEHAERPPRREAFAIENLGLGRRRGHLRLRENALRSLASLFHA